MNKQNQVRYSLGLALLGAIFYIPFLGGVHLFDWDEINFAEISREMILLQDYLRIHVNFIPFWEKPPFFFWLQVLAMNGFGMNEFAARLPNAICGIASLVLLYNMGTKLYNHRFGLIWAFVYFGTILPFLYSKSGIIDPVFNFFIFLGLYCFILFKWKKETSSITLELKAYQYLFLAGFSIGMGILTKGQVAFLIAVLTIFFYWLTELYKTNFRNFIGLSSSLALSFVVFQLSKLFPEQNIWFVLLAVTLVIFLGLALYSFLKDPFFVTLPELLFFTFSATLVTLAWYGLETWKNGTWFIVEFNKYQYRLFSTPDAGHKGFPGYHLVVLLVGCFPASIFTIRSFLNPALPKEKSHQIDFRKWMKYLFWVVLILFTIVKSKIVHYSSMCYYPLTYLAAVVIYYIIENKIPFKQWMKVSLFVVGGLFAGATIALPFVGMDIELIKPLFSRDPFAMANLEAEVNWSGWESIPGFMLLLVMIFGIRWLSKGNRVLGFRTLFMGTGFFVLLTLIFFIGRIEHYSQRAAVTFYESKADEDCYIISHGFKTYAHLFYANKPVVANEKSYDKDWLINGPVDKPVYVVAKIHRADELRSIETLEEIMSKNGFVFFKRKS